MTKILASLLLLTSAPVMANDSQKLKDRFQFYEKNYVRIIFINMNIPSSAAQRMRSFVDRGYNIVLYNDQPDRWTDAEMLLLSEALENLRTPVTVAYWDAGKSEGIFETLAEKLLAEHIMIDQMNSFVVGHSEEDQNFARNNGLSFYDQHDFFAADNCESKLH